RVVAALPDAAASPASARADRAPRPRARSHAGWRLVGAAATLVVVALAAWGWMTRPLTYTAAPGVAEAVTLPDGSQVVLGGGATLQVERRGQALRQARLTGEATFDVVTDPTRPFVVETFNAAVEVLGTRFHVRAWPDDPYAQTDVALEEGRVAVRPLQPVTDSPEGARLELVPGEAASVVANRAVQADSTQATRSLLWQPGGLAFHARPLEAVTASVERHFGVTITLADALLGERPVTYLNLSPSSATSVLTDLCITLQLQYRRTATGYEIYR
ncbi:MAG: FecR domain-containing protein, partial [Bacteroidota bacterium]